MSLSRTGAELKEEASEKVDQAKSKANELAADAKKKGEGIEENNHRYHNFFFLFLIRSQT